MQNLFKLIAALFIVALLIVGYYTYNMLYTPMSKVGEVRVVTIERGENFGQIIEKLTRAGLIESKTGFKALGRIRGSHREIKAGEYELRTDMSPNELITALESGKVRYHSITVPEGFCIKDIAKTLVAANMTGHALFIEKALSEETVKRLALPGPTLEGYLFPDTYRVTRAANVDDLIVMMTDRFKEVYNEKFKAMALRRGMEIKEVITLASIIEKETGLVSEMRTISAVFHNRLSRGIPLQSDPTVIYGIEDFDGNLRRKDLQRKEPYNTYTNAGLPPGPIANPGAEAISAAINPTNEPYLYFVSRNDGSHHFSRTLKEHNIAVRHYQKNRRNRK